MKKKGLPEVNELVIATVKRITPFAAWCELDEYDGVEGMIHISEVAGKWVYDIRNFVKEGKQYVAKVLKVDEEKKQVNLSLKRVSSSEKKLKMSEFRKEVKAEKMLERVAREIGKSLEDAYKEIGEVLKENFGDLFSAFESIKESPEVVNELPIEENWREALKSVAEKLMKKKEVEIKAELEMRSYAPDGIERIKKLLIALRGKVGGNVSYIAASRYRLIVSTRNPKVKEKELLEALESTSNEAKKEGVEYSYKILR
jgi:translation initiation factor 2 subunit 1